MGIDISDGALETARHNAVSLGVSKRAEFLKSDWTEKLQEQFDLIITNPPYIAPGDYAGLPDAVRVYDPKRALVAEEEGYGCYRLLSASIGPFLSSSGFLIVEAGDTMVKKIQDLFTLKGFVWRRNFPDLTGTPRALVFQKEEGYA